MNSFILAFAAGIGVVCSMCGWGWLVKKTLRFKYSAGPGQNAALGLAISTIVGGVIDYVQKVSPAVVLTYLAVGFLLAAWAVLTSTEEIRVTVRLAAVYFRSHKLIACAAALLVLVLGLKYAAATSPGMFNLQDDFHAYVAFPVKMIQTGSLGQDPFSERRIISSLGGQAFLDTFTLSLTGDTKNLHLMDMGVGLLILVLLLTEIMIRKKIPPALTLLVLFICVLFVAPIANVTAVYTGALLFVLLFDRLHLVPVNGDLASSIVSAIALASLISLKTSLAPGAIVFWGMSLLFQWYNASSRAQAIRNSLVSGVLVALFLLPWMLDSYRSSGTLFYPFLGKGFHASRYGGSALPTAQVNIRNLLAFFHGVHDVLFAVLAVQVVLLLLNRPWDERRKTAGLVVGATLVLGVLLIGIGTTGYQVFRYSFPLVFGGVLYLFTEQLAEARGSSAGTALGVSGGVLSLVLAGVLLGSALEGFMTDEENWLATLHFAVTGKPIVSVEEASDYRKMQSAVPPGEKLLVHVDKNFLFDFRRNPVYINDMPAQASLPPGMPVFSGPEPLAGYLLGQGIRYVAYSYADEANFKRAEFGGRLNAKVNYWLRVGAERAFDYQDNMVILGRSRKKVFDNGKMFVLDLAARVPQLVSQTGS